jgi:hypothetical protein
MRVKTKKLSEELSSWWSEQTQFKTKKALATFLEVHPDTVGDYFSGRRFPRTDIATRLCEITNIKWLKNHSGKGLPSEIITHDELNKEEPTSDLTMEGCRQRNRSIIISLQRKNCPFCNHTLTRFSLCAYCGQNFVWAIVLPNE